MHFIVQVSDLSSNRTKKKKKLYLYRKKRRKMHQPTNENKSIKQNYCFQIETLNSNDLSICQTAKDEVNPRK